MRTGAQPPLQDPDASSPFDQLQRVALLGIEKRSVQQKRQTLPRPVHLPHECDAFVRTATSDRDPVLGVGCVQLESAGVGGTGLDGLEVRRRHLLDVPLETAEIQVAVVHQERLVSGVVEEPLLDDVGRPLQVSDQVVAKELGQARDTLAKLLSETGEVREMDGPSSPSSGLAHRVA